MSEEKIIDNDLTPDVITNFLKRKLPEYTNVEVTRVFKEAKNEYDKRHRYMMIIGKTPYRERFCITIYRNGNGDEMDTFAKWLEDTIEFHNGFDFSCDVYTSLSGDISKKERQRVNKYWAVDEIKKKKCTFTQLGSLTSAQKRASQLFDDKTYGKEGEEEEVLTSVPLPELTFEEVLYLIGLEPLIE